MTSSTLSSSTKPVSHYLHPDYLDPIPSSKIHSKQSPLAMLALTCNNIGKDSQLTCGASPTAASKDHNGNKLVDGQSPRLGLVQKTNDVPPCVSPFTSKTKLSSTMNERLTLSPSESKLPSSTTERGESPSSTCSSKHRKSSSSSLHHRSSKRCAPLSPKTASAESINSFSPAAKSSPVANDFIDDVAAARKAAQNYLQFQNSGSLPELVHPFTLLSAATAFGASSHYRPYAGTCNPTLLPPLPPPTSWHDLQCAQCTAHQQPGLYACTCSHCSLHTKSFTEYYHSLLQHSAALPSPPLPPQPPQGKINVEFCMYCGKHCPTLEELLVHMRSHDAPSTASLSPNFGVYPSSGNSLSPDIMRKAWSYATAASRFHPYHRGFAPDRHVPFASVFGAPLV